MGCATSISCHPTKTSRDREIFGTRRLLEDLVGTHTPLVLSTAVGNKNPPWLVGYRRHERHHMGSGITNTLMPTCAVALHMDQVLPEPAVQRLVLQSKMAAASMDHIEESPADMDRGKTATTSSAIDENNSQDPNAINV